MWEKDRAETAEMESRLAMIRKKEEYAAAADSAAASSAQSPATIFRSRKPGAAASGGAGTSSRRGSATSEVESVLPLSPPTPRSPASLNTLSSATTATTADAPSGSAERQHGFKAAVSDVSSVDPHLGSGGKTNSSVPPAAAMQSPEAKIDWDLESGSGGAAVAPGAAGAGSGAPGNSGKGAVDDDLPPPDGWEVRNTPSGDK